MEQTARFHRKTLALLTCALMLGACGDGSKDQAQEKAAAGATAQGMPARVQAPEKRTLVQWSEYTGRFQAQKRVEVRARVSGYLDEITFQDGQIVEKGETLFVIDQRPFQIALDSAKARYDAANNEFKRAKNLRKAKAISEDEYDERLQAMRMAKATLDEAKLNLEFTKVKAPIKGRISNNRIDVGNVVNGSSAGGATLLTTIVSLAPIELYFEASETDFLRYQRAQRDTLHNNSVADERGIGTPVHVMLQDESQYSHKGTINFTDNELSEDTGTIQIRAIFDNEDQLFEPGMFARLRIADGAPSERIIVPQNVIGTEMTRKFVYTLDKDNKATRSYVTLGKLTDDGMQIINSGLSTQDRMIIGGLTILQPGMPIAPITAPAPKAEKAAGGNSNADSPAQAPKDSANQDIPQPVE